VCRLAHGPRTSSHASRCAASGSRSHHMAAVRGAEILTLTIACARIHRELACGAAAPYALAKTWHAHVSASLIDCHGLTSPEDASGTPLSRGERRGHVCMHACACTCTWHSAVLGRRPHAHSHVHPPARGACACAMPITACMAISTTPHTLTPPHHPTTYHISPLNMKRPPEAGWRVAASNACLARRI